LNNSNIFNDTERRTAALQQLSFLLHCDAIRAYAGNGRQWDQ